LSLKLKLKTALATMATSGVLSVRHQRLDKSLYLTKAAC